MEIPRRAERRENPVLAMAISPAAASSASISLHAMSCSICHAASRPYTQPLAQYLCCAIGCWSNQGHVSFSVIATAAPLLLAIAPSLPTMLGHLPSCSDARQGIRRQQLWFYVAGSVLQTAGRVLGKYLMIDIISIRVS
ncbi:hypothetical protein Zm00014a_032652 [Zea mays]|jgi:hypothetical protein|uniref:Uncharacterized protein n=1 Tax=Zea mays TaxID=4577 RepID=A0A3L6FQT1_MAIZE|nr:hypothetical protein Zm00014a_032652 [Zea mays]